MMTTTMTISDLKRALVEVRQICRTGKCCSCPFSQKANGAVCCRLADEDESWVPYAWQIDDWKVDSE